MDYDGLSKKQASVESVTYHSFDSYAHIRYDPHIGHPGRRTVLLDILASQRHSIDRYP